MHDDEAFSLVNSDPLGKILLNALLTQGKDTPDLGQRAMRLLNVVNMHAYMHDTLPTLAKLLGCSTSKAAEALFLSERAGLTLAELVEVGFSLDEDD